MLYGFAYKSWHANAPQEKDKLITISSRYPRKTFSLTDQTCHLSLAEVGVQTDMALFAEPIVADSSSEEDDDMDNVDDERGSALAS